MVSRQTEVIVKRSVVLGSTYYTTSSIECDTVELRHVVATVGREPSCAFVVGNPNTTVVTNVKAIVVVPFHFVVVGMDISW